MRPTMLAPAGSPNTPMPVGGFPWLHIIWNDPSNVYAGGMQLSCVNGKAVWLPYGGDA